MAQKQKFGGSKKGRQSAHNKARRKYERQWERTLANKLRRVHRHNSPSFQAAIVDQVQVAYRKRQGG